MKLFEISDGVNLFDGSMRDSFFENISMAGLRTSGVWFDKSTPVTIEELTPYIESRGYSLSDPLVTRLLNGFESAGNWTLYYDQIGDKFVAVDLDQLRPYNMGAGYTDYYTTDWGGSLGSQVDSTTGSWDNVFGTLWAGKGLPFLRSDSSTVMGEGDTGGYINGVPIPLLSWDGPVENSTILDVYPEASEAFLEYSSNPDKVVDEIMAAYDIEYYVELGTYTLAEWRTIQETGTRGSFSAIEPANFWPVNAGNMVMTPFDMGGKFKIYLTSQIWKGGARFSSLLASCLGAVYFTGSYLKQVMVDDGTQIVGVGQTKSDNILNLVDASGWGAAGYVRGRPMSGAIWNPVASSFYVGDQTQARRTYINANLPAELGNSDGSSVSFVIWDSGDGWGRTLANGFEDVELVGGNYSLNLGNSYPTIEISPIRIHGRVQSEVVIGLIDDVKNKEGISPTDVAKLEQEKTNLASQPNTFSCTFEAAGVPSVTAAEVENTKLWRTILKEKPSLLTDDLGDGVTLKKGKDKLNKARQNNRLFYSACSSASTDEKTDLLITNDAVLQDIVLATNVQIADIGSVTPSYQVTYDGSTYLPDEATLQYIIAATSPTFSGITLADIESHFGWASGWLSDALDYVGAGAYEGDISYSAQSVRWDKIATESFVTSKGFPKIAFSDVDTRARALLAFKGLRDDGGDFFFGSFFPTNAA